VRGEGLERRGEREVYNRGRMRLLLAIFATAVAGCTASTLPPPAAVPPPTADAITFSRSGEAIYYSARGAEGCSLRRVEVASRSDMQVVSRLCAERLEPARTGEVRAIAGTTVRLIGTDGLMREDDILAESRSSSVRAAGGELVWVAGERRISLGSGLRSPRIIGDDVAVVAIRTGDREHLVRFDADGAAHEVIESGFRRIDSFDVSPDDLEIVVSADRGGETGFDVALVPLAGGEPRWIAPDRVDERMVQWAPKGLKFSYVLEMTSGSLIRVVAVQTGFQTAADFPFATIDDYAWHPGGDRYAVRWSSLLSAPAVDLVTNGNERAALVAPAEAFRSEPSVIAVAGGESGVVVPPGTVRYDASVPTVIWLRPSGGMRWNSAIFEVARAGAVHQVVLERPPSEALSREIERLAGFDPSRVFVVDPEGERPGTFEQQWNITYISEVKEDALPDRRLAAGPGSRKVTPPRGIDLHEFAGVWIAAAVKESDGSN
jgi:hypothetical protein